MGREVATHEQLERVRRGLVWSERFKYTGRKRTDGVDAVLLLAARMPDADV
jgi:hypothetical protein